MTGLEIKSVLTVGKNKRSGTVNTVARSIVVNQYLNKPMPGTMARLNCGSVGSVRDE